MNVFAQSYQLLQTQILKCAANAHRSPEEITLILVTKTQTIESIQATTSFGHKHFGENYVQEAIPKIEALDDPTLIWHFIGPIQSNKTTLIGAHFQWVHTLCRPKIAQRLHETRQALNLPPLNCLIQINISQETTKSGLLPSELLNFAKEVQTFSHLRLRGIMVLPSPTHETIAEEFKHSVECFRQLQSQCEGIDTLSMGTSKDFELAIAMGATHLRLGEAFFGARLKNV